MTKHHIKLDSPLLREQVNNYNEYKYRIIDVKYLNNEHFLDCKDIFSICLKRTTERIFYSTNQSDISALFWYTLKTISTRNEFGSLIKHKPVQSAGARHPLDIIYISYSTTEWGCFLYDDHAHALCQIDIKKHALDKFVQHIAQVLDPQYGDIIWFISQDTKTSSKYINHESLIWRDAGVVLGHMALIAEALELNFCPLGISGEQEMKELLGIPPCLSAVGGCIVGRRSS